MQAAPPKSVDDYLAAVPEPQRAALQRLRAQIRAAAPPETVEAISYGIPTFKHRGHLVAFAVFKNHLSFFPMSGALIDAHAEALRGFPTSKGTIRFQPDAPIPEALVEELVKARVAENERLKPA